jgi:hypothetical protein
MLVPVNGRRIFFNRVEGVRKVGTGKFEITASHGLHYAQGGRAAGAAMRLVDGV